MEAEYPLLGYVVCVCESPMKELLNVKLQLIWFHHSFIFNFPFTLYCKRQDKCKLHVMDTVNTMASNLLPPGLRPFHSPHPLDLMEGQVRTYIGDSNEVTRPVPDKWQVHILSLMDYEWNHSMWSPMDSGFLSSLQACLPHTQNACESCDLFHVWVEGSLYCVTSLGEVMRVRIALVCTYSHMWNESMVSLWVTKQLCKWLLCES